MDIAHLAAEALAGFRIHHDTFLAFVRVRGVSPKWVNELVEHSLARMDSLKVVDERRLWFIYGALESIATERQAPLPSDPVSALHELTEWLASAIYRTRYVDRAIAELYGVDAPNVVKLLAMAQHYERKEVHDAVLGFLQEHGQKAA